MNVSSLWLRQLGALIAKEFKQIVHDPSSYLVAGVLPVIFLLLFGYGISLDTRELRVAVINESGGARSLELATAFAHSPSFSVVPAGNRDAAERMLRDTVVRGIVVLRQDFDARLDAGEPGSVQLIMDGAEPNTAQFIYGYASGVMDTWRRTSLPGGAGAPAAIQLETRYWYNPSAKSEQFLVPGSITVIMTLIGTLLTSLVFAREWERGTMEAMFATPVTRMQMLLGKLIPYFCMGMCSMTLCAVAAVWLFHVPFRGSVPALVLLSSVFMCSALGQGLLISVLLRTQLLAAQAGLFSGFLPAMLLSGFIFDINSMPPLLQALTRLIPARYFNTCLQTVFLAGDIWEVFLPSLFFMALLALLMLSFVYKNLVKRLDR